MECYDSRAHWTFNVVAGDYVIYKPYHGRNQGTEEKVKIKCITERLVILENGKKFSRVTFSEKGASRWYSDDIVEFTNERWKQCVADNLSLKRALKVKKLIRAIQESFSFPNDNSNLSLAKLEKIAKLLNITLED